MSGGYKELREMIEWWLTLPDGPDPAYRHRTLDQRRASASWGLAEMIDMHGYKKDPEHPFPPFKKPED